jgi:hypothetical protein
MSEAITATPNRKRPNMTKYLVTLAAVDTDEYVSFAYGEFPTMKFAASAGLKEIAGKPGDFSAKIVEVEAIGTEDEKRTVVSVTGDAETVTVVVKKKIGNERKQYLAETGGDAETVTEDADAPAAE